jgi:hypothetical protein
MSPFIRGQIFPETENVGPAKRKLDVLLWIEALTARDLDSLNRIEVLRAYLQSLNPTHCSIQIHVPNTLDVTSRMLALHWIDFSLVDIPDGTAPQVDAVVAKLPLNLQPVAGTALGCDADIVLINDTSWFPYVTEFDELGSLLANVDVLERQCEIFVRGHDIPWSFSYIAWGLPWTVFYQMGESRLFTVGTRFLDKVHGARLDYKTEDDAQMLIFNRLANLCFTRDRLLFLDMQQAAAKRANWTRQQFAFEVSYYLNFYYLLIFGGFDHLALVVNGVLRLGIGEREVAARGQKFLAALRAKHPEVHAIFTRPEATDFMKRVAALRHFAAHRGSIMPSDIYETPEQEPTVDDLDADIERTGNGAVLNLYPPGTLRDFIRENLRFQARLRIYKRVAEGMVKIKIDGKYFLIRPMSDIEWNFDKFHAFLTTVLETCAARI